MNSRKKKELEDVIRRNKLINRDAASSIPKMRGNYDSNPKVRDS